MRWRIAVGSMMALAAACADPSETTSPTSMSSPTTTSTMSSSAPFELDDRSSEVPFVPYVLDHLLEDAVADIEASGLVSVVVYGAVDRDSAHVGRVIDQKPPPFVLVEPGSVITITIGELASRLWEGMCSHLEEYGGGEPLHGPIIVGEAWPIADADLLLTNGNTVWTVTDGVASAPLLGVETGGPVFTDGAGGLLHDGRFGIERVRADREVVSLTEQPLGPGWPGYQLTGSIEIDGEWFATASYTDSAVPFEDGVGDLVLVPVDGGEERTIRQVFFEEGGGWPFFDGTNLILHWGSLGDYWITGWSVAGTDVELPWNRWSEPATFEDAALVVGAHDGQVVVGVADFSGVLQATVFDARTGEDSWSLDPVELGADVRVRRVTPIGDTLVVSADTPVGPCTRVFERDGSWIDLDVRGWATPFMAEG